MEIIYVSKNHENRILKAKRPENANNLRQVNTIKKCLFGVPDVKDVEDLLREQIKEDWERIKNRFGIDLEDIENIEVGNVETHTPKKRKLESSRSIKISNCRRRKLFQSCSSDKKITDFYQIRKTTKHAEKKDL